MAQDLIAILPQIAVLLSAVAALVAEMLRKPAAALAALAVGLLAALGLALARLGEWTTAFSGTFRVDALSVWAVVILAPACLIAAVMVRSELKGTPREGTLYSLLGFGTLGALLLAGAGDLMFIVLGLLMNGLAGFALVASPRSNAATEGAMKYFVYGSVTGAFMVFGLGYWAGLAGGTLLTGLGGVTAHPLVFALGLLALLAGAGYAASLFPFHFWTPDAFEGAPVAVAGFVSVTPKLGAVFAVAQVVRELPAGGGPALTVMAVMSALSMTFGNIVALLQTRVVRLLAYSTVAQAGYLLIGALAMTHSALATTALVIFGAAYAAMNLGVFASILNLSSRIEDFAGLGRVDPWRAVTLTIMLFSLVGIPPLFGFAGKVLLFGAAIDAGFPWLSVIAIFNSVLSLGVYLRLIVPVWFSTPSRRHSIGTPTSLRLCWATCLFFTLAGALLVPAMVSVP